MICPDGGYNCNIYCNEQNGCYNNTINCGNSSMCNIQCRGYRSCSSAKIYCGHQSQCNIFCHGGNSCESVQLDCGTNSNCSIQCNAYGQYGNAATNKHYECSYMTIKATQSNSLTIDVYNNLYSALSMEVYTPNTQNSSPTVIRCGIADNVPSSMQYSCDKIQIHSAEGWNDVQLELAMNANDVFTDYTDQNQAMFCGIHDEYFCYGLTGDMRCDDNIVICNNKTLTNSPTCVPTKSPSKTPSKGPTQSPSNSPSNSPSEAPSQSPSDSPSDSTTSFPSHLPTESPSQFPFESPSDSTTSFPSHLPTAIPSKAPTETHGPTNDPTDYPSNTPINNPTKIPSVYGIGTPTLYGGSQSACLDFIVKESGNCGDGYTDLDASDGLYGKCCQPCPDGKAGTYGKCKTCGTGETPNHSRTECELWQPWWLWIVEIMLSLGVLGVIVWTIKWCVQRKKKANVDSEKHTNVDNVVPEGVDVTVNKVNKINKSQMDKSQSLIDSNKAQIAAHIELTQIELTQNDYKPPH
eukprot:299267_1